MGKFFSNSRFYILVFSFVLSIGIYFYVLVTYTAAQLQIIRLTQMYAFTAVSFLYITMLVGPLSRFTNGPFIQAWTHARRAFGVSVFYFSLLHGCFAFFGQLDGFAGLGFLSDYYLWGIGLSFTALLILSALALTSFDWVIAKMKFKRWKLLQQLVYLAGVFILIHAMMLGTHFHDLSELIPLVMFIAVFSLLLLHAMCWEKKYQGLLFVQRFGLLSLVVLLTMPLFYFYYMNPLSGSGSSSPLSVHSQHTISGMEMGAIPLASGQKTQLYMPGMEGDRKMRFLVQLLQPEKIVVNTDTELKFRITNAANGEPIYYFQTPYEKPFHFIIVNQDLSYFAHIHPVQVGNDFVITTKFPKDDQYYLYADFQPFGAIEQQFGFQVGVGKTKSESVVADYYLQKDVGDYTVSLAHDDKLLSKNMSVGLQKLTFTITEKNGNPVKNLQPYLAAFGHLVMIKQDSFEYVHAHPLMTRRVLPGEVSGPEVQFIPMSVYGDISPGVYRIFSQFNPNGILIMADFWIKVD